VWNWQWNCGSAPSAPCSDCNTAVAIRILSPGDDGAVAQSISSTSTSLVQTISQSLQQSVQQIVQPAALQPAPIGLPALPGAIDPIPWPSLGVSVPTSLPEPTAWPTIGPGPGGMTVEATLTVLLPLDTGAISLGDESGSLIELPAFDAVSLDDPLDGVLERPFAVAGVTQTEAETGASLATRPAPLAPPRREEAASAAGSSQAPSKPQLPLRLPERSPLGSGPDVSTGAAASGSSSSLGGFALLLGVLLVAVPSALQLIWVGAVVRPRRYTPGPPEHPG
jgi:hypothetical protein